MTADMDFQIANDDETMEERRNDAHILAPFNPVSESAMSIALELLKLQADDVLFDLGAGDGRLLISAVKSTPRLRCVGIELDQKFVDKAFNSAGRLPSDIRKRVQFRHGDALQAIEGPCVSEDPENFCNKLSIYDATALFLFLLPKGLKMLVPLLEQVAKDRKGRGLPFRVVAYMFHVPVPGWIPTTVDRNSKAGSPVYLYNLA
jgi:SAM-dependent methyltransferase